MTTFTFVLLALSLTEEPIDDFRYADNAAAAQNWSVNPNTPPLRAVENEGRNVLQLNAPFRDQAELARVYVDRRVDLDLCAAGGFVLEAVAEPPEALMHVTLYFHSGGGWLGAGGRASKPGWQRLKFAKSSFGREESPAGWDKIDGIRIAVWRGAAGESSNAVIRLRLLAAVQEDVALVVPSTARGSDDPEVRSAQQIADDMSQMLATLGLEADRIDEETVCETRGRAGTAAGGDPGA